MTDLIEKRILKKIVFLLEADYTTDYDSLKNLETFFKESCIDSKFKNILLEYIFNKISLTFCYDELLIFNNYKLINAKLNKLDKIIFEVIFNERRDQFADMS